MLVDIYLSYKNYFKKVLPNKCSYYIMLLSKGVVKIKTKLETISNLFEGREIRSIWDSEKEEYYFSIVDVIGVLTNANIPRNYWSDLKRKLKDEGSELHEKIVQLKMKSKKDGKNYLTDILDTKGNIKIN